MSPPIGSLWRVGRGPLNGCVYRVVSTDDTSDPGYPILMQRVHQSNEWDRMMDDFYARNRIAIPDVESRYGRNQPLHVEAAWFRRADIREVRP